MKLYLGLLEASAPFQTRIFGEFDGTLVDLRLAYAAYLDRRGGQAPPYEQAAFYFPETLANFFQRGEPSLHALHEVVSYAHERGVSALSGPAGERVAYARAEIRRLPPLKNPEKSIVVGFADRARVEAVPPAEIPTGFYKLPQTFVTDGAPIAWPEFSEEIDADACVALVIGRAGRRIPPEKAWDHVAGASLLIDFTARDINRREGLTTNNLLGKNFPSSTSLGPGVLTKPAREELEAMEVELTVDGASRQHFKLRDCVFIVEQIVARWSILGVKPGDFLAIGASMSLKHDRLQDPAALKIGSTIRCSSPALGELTHRIVSSEGATR